MLTNYLLSEAPKKSLSSRNPSTQLMETPVKLAIFLLIPSSILAYPLISKLISNLYYFQLIAQLAFVLLWCTLLKYVDLLFPLEKEAGEQMLKIQDNVTNKGTFKRKDSLANTN